MYVIFRLFLLAVCLAVAGLCAVLFAREYAVVFMVRGNVNSQIDSMVASDFAYPEPSSSRSIRELLSVCARLLSESPKLKAEPELGTKVRDRCATIADEILVSSPSNARALALRAMTEQPVTAQTLAAAQLAAPYEPWILVIRLRTLAAASPLSSDLAALMQGDLSRALRSPWGRRAIARIYVDEVELRPLFQAALETQAASDQADFLRQVRRANRPIFDF